MNLSASVFVLFSPPARRKSVIWCRAALSINHFSSASQDSPSCCSPQPPPCSPSAPAPSAPLYWWGRCSLLIVGASSARTVQNSCMHIHHRRPVKVQADTESPPPPFLSGSSCVLCREKKNPLRRRRVDGLVRVEAPARAVCVNPWSRAVKRAGQTPSSSTAASSASQPRGESPSAPPEGRDGGFSVFRGALTCEEDSEGANSKTSRHPDWQLTV